MQEELKVACRVHLNLTLTCQSIDNSINLEALASAKTSDVEVGAESHLRWTRPVESETVRVLTQASRSGPNQNTNSRDKRNGADCQSTESVHIALSYPLEPLTLPVFFYSYTVLKSTGSA